MTVTYRLVVKVEIELLEGEAVNAENDEYLEALYESISLDSNFDNGTLKVESVERDD